MILDENLFLSEDSKKKKNKKTDYSIPQSKFKTVNDILKFHKKRQKGQGSFVTYDVGNMDYNNSLFNKMMGGSGESITSSGTSADGAVSFAGGISNGGLSAGASTGGGMGESLELNETSSNNNIVEVSDAVQKYLEDNIDNLEKDEEAFLLKLLDKKNFILTKQQKGELITLLDKIGIHITNDILDMMGYDYIYFDPKSKNTDQDYIKLLEDLVKNVPNRYIDYYLYKDKSAYDVFKVIDNYEPIINNMLFEEVGIPDPTSYTEDIRVELGLNKSYGFELKIVIETAGEVSQIGVGPFSNIYLGSYGYIIDKTEANIRLDLIKQFVEEALQK